MSKAKQTKEAGYKPLREGMLHIRKGNIIRSRTGKEYIIVASDPKGFSLSRSETGSPVRITVKRLQKVLAHLQRQVAGAVDAADLGVRDLVARRAAAGGRQEGQQPEREVRARQQLELSPSPARRRARSRARTPSAGRPVRRSRRGRARA